MVTTKHFFSCFFFIANIFLFYQKCKSLGLHLYPLFYLSVLFLPCWEFILSSLSDLAPTHYLTPPSYLHIDNHVPPPTPICDWQRRLHSWPFRSPNCVKASASTNTVKNASASSAIFEQKVDGIHSARVKAGAARTIIKARRRPAASRASAAPAPPASPSPWRRQHTRTLATLATRKDKDGDGGGNGNEDEVAMKRTTK